MGKLNRVKLQNKEVNEIITFWVLSERRAKVVIIFKF